MLGSHQGRAEMSALSGAVEGGLWARQQPSLSDHLHLPIIDLSSSEEGAKGHSTLPGDSNYFSQPCVCSSALTAQGFRTLDVLDCIDWGRLRELRHYPIIYPGWTFSGVALVMKPSPTLTNLVPHYPRVNYGGIIFFLNSTWAKSKVKDFNVFVCFDLVNNYYIIVCVCGVGAQAGSEDRSVESSLSFLPYKDSRDKTQAE